MRLLVRLFAGDRGFEQRQRQIVGQSPYRPQGRAAVEPDRAKRVGIGQQDQRAFWQRRVAGKVFQRGEGPAFSCGDDAVGPVVVIPSGGRIR